MGDFVPAAAMLVLVVKVVDFLRYAKARDMNGMLTQLIAWAGGVTTVFVAAHTPWAPAIVLGGVPLSKLNMLAIVFAGLAIGSGGSLTSDLRKVFDNSNSAIIPTLVSTPSKPPANTTG